jgi:AraC-like DNA-binding protein
MLPNEIGFPRVLRELRILQRILFQANANLCIDCRSQNKNRRDGFGFRQSRINTSQRLINSPKTYLQKLPRQVPPRNRRVIPFNQQLNKQSTMQTSSGPGSRTDHSNRDRRVQAVKMLIEDNFHRRLDLSEMAKAVNLSPWRLAHLFKAEVGISPLRYLSLIRLQRARLYLETGFLTVREIAASVGIPNASHFTRSFRAAYGSSPVQHRSAHFRIAATRDNGGALR